MNTIGERMKSLIHNWLPERKRFAKLEELSGIPSDHWKNFWHGRQRAHEHMIQAIARQWPEHALWLVTGIADEEFGQTKPNTASNAKRSEAGLMLLRKVQLQEWIHLSSTLAELDAAKDSGAKPEDDRRHIEQAAESLFRRYKLMELHNIDPGENPEAASALLEEHVFKDDEELHAHRVARLRELGIDGNPES